MVIAKTQSRPAAPQQQPAPQRPASTQPKNSGKRNTPYAQPIQKDGKDIYEVVDVKNVEEIAE